MLLSLVLGAGNTAVNPTATPISAATRVVASATDAITIPRMLSYQGKLLDTAGRPVPDADYTVSFRLYAVPSGGAAFWNETQTVRTRSGLFSALLGTVSPVGGLPEGGALYLGMQVESDPEMTPRVRIASAAYAYLAQKADTANYALNGAGDNAWLRGVPDSVLYTVRQLGVALGGAGNMLYGAQRNSHINLGAACTTGTSGQDYNSCTVGGGYRNIASASGATVAGGFLGNASGNHATVGGGWDNTASGNYATVSGGRHDSASGDYAAISGGVNNTVKAHYGGIHSGNSNHAGSAASDTAAAVAGGRNNTATGVYSFVGGGLDNSASLYATVSGGRSNAAGDSCATVGGGERDSALDTYATVGGGYYNVASGHCAAIAGGSTNLASGEASAVDGGWINKATGRYSTVTGGKGNLASGDYAIAAGWLDTAAGDMSFATNYRSYVPADYWISSAFNDMTVTASGQTRVGTLSKASGTFTIDHPLDPAGTILNHYFIEGPEMRNIYDGETILDASGKAAVALPAYFDALNRKPRVQLTGVGSREAVYVAEDVSGNRFVIGGPAGAKVYWQVTGERRDVSAEVTRRMMPVEQPKTGSLAGRMLDDEFLCACMAQLLREGKAHGIDFRTAAGRQRYENMKRELSEERSPGKGSKP
jgi:hypothetical protein